LPHPGSSHLYVRRWDTGDNDVVESARVRPTVADAGCLATGGAGAMGQSRPELSGGDAAAQLTTMIAAGAEVSGTSMPPTLVSTTGNETPGLAAAFPPATAVTAAVVGGDDMLSADEVSCSPLATAAVCLLSDGITCTSDR